MKEKYVSRAGFEPVSPRRTTRPTRMREDAGSNPAWDADFSFISETCRKPLVSYLHLSFIVSKAFLAQIIYILFVTYLHKENEREKNH